MMPENRQHKRINKKIHVSFCVGDLLLKKWDISEIENISVGGVKFSAGKDMIFKNQTLYLRIRVPELAPVLLELEARVIAVEVGKNGMHTDIRAQFIHVSEANQKHLETLEKIIDKASQ